MANPISIRPWSRLASLRSSPVSDSHPKAHIAEPSFKTTNASSNDNNSNSAAATKSLPTSPNVHNGIHSQNLKLITPMTFPPAKLKVHPQPMVEVTMEKPNANDNASLKNESGETKNQGNEKQATNKENKMKEKGAHTKVSGSEGRGTRVITISGENRGAYMQIIQSQKKPIHKMGNCDGEKVKTVCSPPMRAMYGNSNVQCVNNSMLFHTSLTHNDPGVHIIIPKKPIRVDDQRN